ncbi:GTP pyrophosphokinase family protein [Paenibacillus sp. GCM10027626]|uniref:GTP pyrophosphokinase n=1 Tax=Paenibacillus sp. GCM10027626 TaxID=3273411 RepID=UPI00363E9645
MNTELRLDQLANFRHKLTRFMMSYKFALQEMETKVEILKEEFHLLHDYNPIEHTKSRLKSPESIMKKLYRKNYEVSLAGIRQNIRDIAGLRITCSFISDIYRVSEMLSNHDDLTIVEVKDYIKYPKPNGYRSLHLLIEVPVFMSDHQERVCVEVQIRTIAMDFWASLEHKIFYKFDRAVPSQLTEELKIAADTATALDHRMERLHTEIKEIKEEHAEKDMLEMQQIILSNQHISIPSALLQLLDEGSN